LPDISLIVATDLNYAIGKNNKLLWHLPADLQFFKKTTMGCPIIMGRKTYESIGRLLPGRVNVIITRNKDYIIDGAIMCDSLENAINSTSDHQKVFIIGGGEIYKLGLPLANEVYRTKVNSEFEADTFFPSLEKQNFQIEWEEIHKADEKNKFDYTYEKWVRKN
jgi:dihydrofolate reductase